MPCTSMAAAYFSFLKRSLPSSLHCFAFSMAAWLVGRRGASTEGSDTDGGGAAGGG